MKRRKRWWRLEDCMLLALRDMNQGELTISCGVAVVVKEILEALGFS
jgi:hypothetical protein